MALKQTTTLENGIVVTNGYWRLGEMYCEEKKQGNIQKVKANVLLYKDQEARNSDLPPVISIKIEFNYDLSKNTNIFEQGYSFLKKQELFSNAIDC